MPVFIGDVLESCGGPILDLAGNKVKGVGIFGSSDDRDSLDTEFRTSGYLSVVDGDLEVYSGVTWDDANSWTKIASEFSLYPLIDPPDGVDSTSPARATSFVVNTEENQDRYSFGVYDSTDDLFRKITGEDLGSIITHYFGEQLAIHLSETTGNDITVYSDSTTGLTGDVNGDGIVTVSDILSLLGNFGVGLDESYRNYSINLGSTWHTGSGDAEPLIGTASSFTEGPVSYMEAVFGLDSFGNNHSVSGDQVGDDITVGGGGFTNPRIVVEHLAAGSNENTNLISFLVNAQGGVPISSVASGQSTINVGHTIRFYTNGDPLSTIVASCTTNSASDFLSSPIKLACRIYLYNQEGGSNLTAVSGLPYTEVILGDLVQPPFPFAGTFDFPLGNLDTSNVIPQLISDFALSIDTVVHQIHFEFVVLNNGVSFFGGGISGLAESFEVKNLRINLVGAGGLG
jgi:hypothetical protein